MDDILNRIAGQIRQERVLETLSQVVEGKIGDRDGKGIRLTESDRRVATAHRLLAESGLMPEMLTPHFTEKVEDCDSETQMVQLIEERRTLQEDSLASVKETRRGERDERLTFDSVDQAVEHVAGSMAR